MHRDQIFDSACRQILLQKLALYLLTFLFFFENINFKAKTAVDSFWQLFLNKLGNLLFQHLCTSDLFVPLEITF